MKNIIGWMNNIFEYLEEVIPNPRSELNYTKDYELLISVMLSAQTTDKRVNQVCEVLYFKYNTLEKLKTANLDDIKSIIRSLGSFNKKSQNIINIATRLVEEKNGIVPNDREYLESLSGVGRKTTNVVLSILFDEPYIAVDTHIERVSKRLGIAKPSDNVLQVEQKLTKLLEGSNMARRHHQLLLFGRYFCKAKNPLCDNCKLKNICKKNEL